MKRSPSRKPSRESLPKSRKAKKAGRGVVRFKVRPKLARGYPVKRYNKGAGKPVPKDVKALISKARRYKKTGRAQGAKLSKRYNAALDKRLAARGYTPDHIRAVKKYRLTGKISALSVTEVSFVHGRFKYKGKFISKTKAKRVTWAYRYNRTIKHYRELYGLTYKQSQELWRALRDENFGEAVFKALY